MSKELYKRFRPRSLKTFIGNEGTVKSLGNMLTQKTLPHTVLFHGPSGCGKTTLARILKKELDCNDIDFQELNIADFRGIDTARDIRQTMHLAPVGGKCKVYLMDEFHQATTQLQNSMLKLLEDTPEHVYFFLCTTDPQKLIKTIRTRCCEMPVSLLSESNVKKLLSRVIKKLSLKIAPDIIEDIIDASEGSARKALVLLDKIMNLPEKERSDAISIQDEEREGIELCRALLKKENWSKVSKILKSVKEDPEKLRWQIMGYARNTLLRGSNHQAFHIITCFENHFYDSKQNGLVRACYEAIHGEI